MLPMQGVLGAALPMAPQVGVGRWENRHNSLVSKSLGISRSASMTPNTSDKRSWAGGHRMIWAGQSISAALDGIMPPNPYVEVLTRNGTVFGEGPLGSHRVR